MKLYSALQTQTSGAGLPAAVLLVLTPCSVSSLFTEGYLFLQRESPLFTAQWSGSVHSHNEAGSKSHKDDLQEKVPPSHPSTAALYKVQEWQWMKSPFQILDPFRVKAFLYQLTEEPTVSAVDFPISSPQNCTILSFLIFCGFQFERIFAANHRRICMRAPWNQFKITHKTQLWRRPIQLKLKKAHPAVIVDVVILKEELWPRQGKV